MNIYYLKKSEFLPNINNASLLSFSDGRKYSSVEKEIEHLCGIFLTKFIAKNVFDIKNTEIEITNKKPHFKTNKIYFSISHSEDIVLVAFNITNIGADIEFMRDRNYHALLNRFGQKNKKITQKGFYRFWTFKEADFKLGEDSKSIFSKTIDKEYILTCVTNDNFASKPTIKKITCKGKNINLTEELNNPSMIKL